MKGREKEKLSIGNLKYILVGGEKVGKSSIFRRLVNPSLFDEQYTPTIGIDFENFPRGVAEVKAAISVADFSGQKAYRSLLPSSISDRNIILVMDNTPESLEEVKSMMDYIEKNSLRKDFTYNALIINKTDLDFPVNLKEEAKQFAKEKGVEVYEVSAKENKEIANTFDTIFRGSAQPLIDLQNKNNFNINPNIEIKSEADQMADLRAQIKKKYTALSEFLGKEVRREDFIGAAGEEKKRLFSECQTTLVGNYKAQVEKIDAVENRSSLWNLNKQLNNLIEDSKNIAKQHTQTRKTSPGMWLLKFNMFRNTKSLNDFNKCFNDKNEPKTPRKK